MQKIKKILFFIILSIPTLLTGIYIYAFSPTFLSAPIAPKNEQILLPTEPFIIKFDNQINKSYYKNRIHLSPKTAMKAIINNNETQIALIPTNGWKINTKYTVSLPEARTKKFTQINKAVFHFKIKDYPHVTNTKPYNKEKDVFMDIEEPIIINFDKPTTGFYIDFRFSPDIPVVYQNNTDKTQFKLLTKNKIEPNTTYTLTLYAKPKDTINKNYNKIYTLTFTTRPPKPKTWAQNLQERLTQAQRFTQPKIKIGKYIDINLQTQIMTIFENGENKGSFLISSGKPGMDTPKGTHKIYNKHPRPWSKKYGLYMPYWMAITPSGKYGIHELPEWPGGYKEGANHLGIKVSHGCVRLGVGPAQNVYNWAEIGTPVIVY